MIGCYFERDIRVRMVENNLLLLKGNHRSDDRKNHVLLKYCVTN
jgi:hypothetical protein